MAWANDSPSRGLYEADGTTCASTQFIEFGAPVGETRKYWLKEMHHKKRGDNPTTDIAFVPAIKIEYYVDGAWGTYYTSDTYPDGKIPTGLTPTTPDEIQTTAFDPPILTSHFRMYFLPHDDGKIRKGASCAVDTRVDFTVVFEETYETIPGESLGAATDVTHCMEMADQNGFNRAAIYD